jgi:hypothetical protein
MTTTNHVTVGAIVALVLKQPALIVPVAFVSHFALDAMPHFGIPAGIKSRNSRPIFKLVAMGDAFLTAALLAGIPRLCAGDVRSWVILSGMLGALTPDLVWVYRFIGEISTGKEKPKGTFSRFHKKIQWCERPWGLAVEGAVFSLGLYALSVLS